MIFMIPQRPSLLIVGPLLLFLIMPGLTIPVKGVGSPPTVELGPDVQGYVGYSVDLSANMVVHDVDTSSYYLDYSWDYDARDGLQTDYSYTYASNTYLVPGNYTVTLTVTDSDGNIGKDTMHVNVKTLVGETEKEYPVSDGYAAVKTVRASGYIAFSIYLKEKDTLSINFKVLDGDPLEVLLLTYDEMTMFKTLGNTSMTYQVLPMGETSKSVDKKVTSYMSATHYIVVDNQFLGAYGTWFSSIKGNSTQFKITIKHSSAPATADPMFMYCALPIIIIMVAFVIGVIVVLRFYQKEKLEKMQAQSRQGVMVLQPYPPAYGQQQYVQAPGPYQDPYGQSQYSNQYDQRPKPPYQGGL